MTLEGGVLENSMTCLQACAGTRELFPCWEAIDPSKKGRPHFLLGLICDA
jgi:hypothetical protein